MPGKVVPKHDHTPLIFPEGFLWGAATSSHQVEGGNTLNDWWDYESKGKLKTNTGEITPSSGAACDQYNKFEEDFKLLKDLGHNAHRLSVEWSRIEPEEGKFNQEEIEHYKKVLKSLKDKGISVMLTLHHFTNPVWFSNKGGWENFKSPYYFERFVQKIVPELKDYVDLWVTINEPGVYAYGGYTQCHWPPQKKSNWLFFKVLWNMARAHKKTYKLIHQLVPKAQVGIANNVHSFDVFHHHSILENLTKWGMDISVNHIFYMLTGKKTHDFLGLNYYFNHYISFNGEAKLPKMVDITMSRREVSDMGWEIAPEGMFDILMDFTDFHLPIYITENGIATSNDDRRIRFLLSYLKEIYHAINAGANVKGYFHWSFMDNFEWADGFEPRFGLVEVDYETQERIPRPSALIYKDIIKNNGIRHDLMKFLGHRIHADEVIEIPGLGKLKEA